MEIISEDVGLAKTDGLKAILAGGLTAGILDITAASVNVWLRSGRGPVSTFQSVAGGLYLTAATAPPRSGWRCIFLSR
jgi:hypothetical protein